MARFFRSLRKTLTHQIHIQQQQLCLSPLPRIISRRTYISEMRKEAFEGQISRLLRTEIQYELHSSPPSNPPTNKFGSFLVDGRPGDRWVTLKRQFADENIKVEVTMFDGAVPAPKKSGGVANADEVQLHITLIVNISKGDGSVLEIMCSAWPDNIEIKRLFIRTNKKMSAEPYAGPDFEELDDELQESLYDFLEARGINDELAKYLHQYMKHKDKTELIGWMEKVKSFNERK
ncbi:Mitochondrial glycoprotein family protein [Trifolium repens]|nr:Mitochondrial glycoprotein family protein [Trifolium repens]